MSDTARVLLTAAVLSAIALASFAWRVTRIDTDDTDRLIGELRLMQWAGVMLAAVSAIPIGLALAAPAAPLAHLDITLAAMFIGLAGLVLQRDPREGLLLACAGFFAHALIDIAHRPGWLAPDLAPRWYTIGCAIYNVFLAGWCFWVRRR
ncbi:MAG: hypothetical protein IT183_02325 [Acidobacteria bacterium]|nr:hypothetical protein [Acidobacteriota bacterium]